MIKVTVWNEYLEELQYEHVAKVYPNGIHECIREFLEKDPEIQVGSLCNLADGGSGIVRRNSE